MVTGWLDGGTGGALLAEGSGWILEYSEPVVLWVLLGLFGVLVASAIRSLRGRAAGQGPAWAMWLQVGVLVLMAPVLAGVMTGPGWRLGWLLLSGAGLLLGACVVAGYVQAWALLPRMRLGVLVGLRLGAAALLLLLLFRPLQSGEVGTGAGRALVVLVDSSQSMGTQDVGGHGADGGGASRLVAAAEAVDTLRTVWAREGGVQIYHFDTLVQPVRDGQRILQRGAVGQGTDLVAAFREGAGRHAGEAVAGVFLLSDGAHNGSASRAEVVEAARERGWPVYAVSLGDSGAGGGLLAADVAVRSAQSASVVAAVNNRTSVEVELTASGLGGRSIAVELVEGESVLDSRRVEVSASGEQQLRVSLDYTPLSAGLKRLEVRARLDAAERVTANNAVGVRLLAIQPELRVLMVEATLRPEAGRVRRALSEDADLLLSFYVQVRPGEFRLRRDQPGGASAGALSDEPADLPRSVEDFSRYDVIILGDVPRRLLSQAQQEAIAGAVRGGKGLLMVGGTNTLGPGEWGGSAVEGVMPVRFGGVTLADGSSRQDGSRFVPVVTGAGRRHAIFSAGLADWFLPPGEVASSGATAGVERLAELFGCVLVEEVRPGAVVLLENDQRRHRGERAVVLAVQQVGRGRSAVLTIDTTNVWARSAAVQGRRSPFEQFWGQLVRWLASLEEGRGEAESACLLVSQARLVDRGEAVPVRLRVFESGSRPSTGARVRARLAEPDGVLVEQDLEPDAQEAGLYTGRLAVRRHGSHRLQVKAVRAGADWDDPAGLLGVDEDAFEVRGAGGELEDVRPDVDLLEQIAVATGGALVAAGEVGELAGGLVGQGGRRGERVGGMQRSVLDVPWPVVPVLVLFVGMLTGEWLLRRRWQLV